MKINLYVGHELFAYTLLDICISVCESGWKLML